MTTSDLPNPTTGVSMGAFASVFQAVGGLRNRRALLTLLGCLFSGVLVSGLASRMGSLGVVLVPLIFLVAVGTGVNAAGVLLMDQARGVASRGTVDALVHGLMCIPKLIVMGLALLLVEIAVFIVLALVFLICKIPFLGPLLYVVVFPVSVIVVGLTLFGLFLCMVLALPAIWEGLTITRAIAQTLAIARTRLIESLLLLAAVGLLCMVVGFIVFGILGTGLVPTLGLQGSILGGGLGGLESLAGMVQGYGGGGYAIAAMVGGGLLWALAATLIGQVYLLGLNIVYLRVTEGLDTSATHAVLLRGFDDAKRRSAELGNRARAAAARERNPAPQAGTAAAPVPAPQPTAPTGDSAFTRTAPVAVAMACPNCSAACTTDDLFCGVCGQRLQ
jgi:hypothetical protein